MCCDQDSSTITIRCTGTKVDQSKCLLIAIICFVGQLLRQPSNCSQINSIHLSFQFRFVHQLSSITSRLSEYEYELRTTLIEQCFGICVHRKPFSGFVSYFRFLTLHFSNVRLQHQKSLQSREIV